MKKLLPVLALYILLPACGTVDQLAGVGTQPALSPIVDPRARAGYRPASMPGTAEVKAPGYNNNSLWRTGARAFFEDQRAARVGDIVTVLVTISDQAQIDNKSARSRSNDSAIGASGSVGAVIDSLFLPAGQDPAQLIGISGSSSYDGAGSVGRSETLQTTVAAVVTQVLPNGNMVIEGRQEVRVNFEVRELVVAGVVRPQDIAADNTIQSAKIAEARIGYGGRGQISAVQAPPVGTQILDVLSPF